MKSKLFVIVFIYCIYLSFTDAQNIVIGGENPRTADGGGTVVIICNVVSGVADGEDPRLEWYDQRGSKVPASGRISVLSTGNTELRLLINNVEEDDAGPYNCTGYVNGKLESAHILVKTKMPLVVTEAQAPRTQYFAEGDDARVKCAPLGDLRVVWRDREGNPISSQSDKYVIGLGYLEIRSINRTEDGNFQCLVMSNTNLKVVSISVIVTVPPTIVKAPTGQSVSVGQPARFECVAVAKPEATYFWYKDNGGLELGGERYNITKELGIFIIKSVIKDDAGTYKCVARSRESADEKSAPLKVLVPPKIVTLDNTTADEGTEATITCTASGEPIPTIKWQREGSSNDFSEGSQQDNTNVVVSHQQRPDRMEVIGSLTISNLKSSDAGFYLCKPSNEAKTVQQSVYLNVQYKPNFSKTKEDVVYSWGGQSTGVNCIASSVPTANISWYKSDTQINAGDQYYSIRQVTVGEDTTSTLTVNVDFSNENAVFGVYSCKAGNAIGVNNKNFTLRRADPPNSPSVSIKETTPTSVTMEINVPTVLNGPPVTEIEIQYGVDKKHTTPVGSPGMVEVKLDALTPSQTYTVRVYAINEVGNGPELSLPVNTPAPRKPYPIIIESNPNGKYPTKFDLHWNAPNSGGYKINEINIRYRQVEVYPNRTANNQYQRKQHLSGWYTQPKANEDSTAYQLRSLLPSQYYEVEVTATNSKGISEARPFIFKTESVKSSGYADFAQALLPSKIVLTMATVLWACLGFIV